VLPVAAALLAVGVKLVTMYAFAAAGAAAYEDGRHRRSETSFGRLDTLNVIEPWRAHVGVGDARHRQGDLAGATAAFARALELAPGRCDIRFNLAVTIEAQGDELVAATELSRGNRPGGQADPAEPYSVALGVIEAGECPSRRADDAGDRLEATRARLLAKLAALDDRPGEEEAADPEEMTDGERGDSERVDEVELRNAAGANQREEARDRDVSGAIPDGQSNW
jgi:Flp pilus assembly protein TadD